jgi:hypothetical protein
MGLFETKAFGAFVLQLARVGMGQAMPLEIFVRQADDNVQKVRREIENDTNRGIITPERAEELQGLVDVLMRWHKTHGYVEEHFDPRDWASLGNGGHMRLKHLDENYEHVSNPLTVITVEQELTKENIDEE